MTRKVGRFVRSARQASRGGGWRVLPTAGGAHLVLRTEMQPHGLLKLAAPLLRRRMQPMFERDLRNIKARLEAADMAPEPGPGRGPDAADQASSR